MNFLKYIFNESMESMIRQIFEALKVDSRKGDFVALVKEDMETLNNDLSEEDRSEERRVTEVARSTLRINLV